ncbi:hypothetical protein BDN71DRAFT_1505436 [Pleurotus eryngii]|uniref:Uncharacterized protein n=1 Tax=Pleurotus eryngii TaxID=5323 RepID=A0A9P6A001_PLEER|nr:hypothetical protein BDN71DRAFT_1505436 [Pleurotus eryngii]
MLGWSGEADTIPEILNVAKAMKTALKKLNSLVSVDDDIFMSQPAMSTPHHNGSLDAFKLEIEDLFCSLEANISTRISNVERHLSPGSTSCQSTPMTHKDLSAQQQPPTPTTYAAVAKSGPPDLPKQIQQPKAIRASPGAKSNTKFIVHFQGCLPPEANHKSSQLLFYSLNQSFNNNAAACNDGLEILGTKWNHSGNIVLTFPSHVNPSVVYNHTDLIHSIVDHNINNIIISHDTKWSKAVCSRVPSTWFRRIGLDKANSSPEGHPIYGLSVSPAWETFAPLFLEQPKVATYVRCNIMGLAATPCPDIAKHPNC